MESPWWTEEEKEQAAKEFHFLKQPTIVDQKQTNIWRDINCMYFKREVLDKFRNNEFCDIVDQERISFLGYDKNIESTVRFYSRNRQTIQGVWFTVLQMQAQDYINVPPKERKHWSQYEIPESEIQFK